MDRDEFNRRAFLKSAAGGALSAALTGFSGDLAKAAEGHGEIPTRTLGRTGLRVSMMGIGGHHAALPKNEEDTISIIQRAIDLGMNFFDNADCYESSGVVGGAEERMGKALEGRRQKIILMTKVDQRDAKGSRQTLETSLRRLRTDYLDIWQFHAVGKIEELDQLLAPGGALETAQQAKKEGKIRFIGLTGHYDPAVHLQAIKRYPFDTIQMPINVVDPHFKSFRKTVVDEAVRRNAGIIAMKTLSYGHIITLGVAQPAEALSWVWSQPISVLVSGCDRMEVLNYNVYLAKSFKPMSESEQAALMARTAAHKGTRVEWYKA